MTTGKLRGPISNLVLSGAVTGDGWFADGLELVSKTISAPQRVRATGVCHVQTRDPGLNPPSERTAIGHYHCLGRSENSKLIACTARGLGKDQVPIAVLLNKFGCGTLNPQHDELGELALDLLRIEEANRLAQIDAANVHSENTA